MWGFWVVAASLLQAIISAIGIFFIIQTLRQGRMSIRTAFSGLRQAGRQSRAAEAGLAETLRVNEAEMRPYLFIDRIELEPEKVDWGRSYNATIFLKNFGRLPARNIKVRCCCYFTKSLGRLRAIKKNEATPIPVCAPGHERQYFDGTALSRVDDTLLETDLGVIVLRLAYSYDAGDAPTYSESFDYVFTCRSLESRLFYILSNETRKRRNEILKMRWRLKRREDQQHRREGRKRRKAASH